MRTSEDIQAYLDRSGHPYREIGDGTWLVGDGSGTSENIVVRAHDELCIFRMKVLDLAAVDGSRSRDFYLTLLQLNAKDLVHGAYGIADGAVLLTASLSLENLDYNEFVAVIEDLIISITNHYGRLVTFQSQTAAHTKPS